MYLKLPIFKYVLQAKFVVHCQRCGIMQQQRWLTYRRCDYKTSYVHFFTFFIFHDLTTMSINSVAYERKYYIFISKVCKTEF